MTLIVSSTRGQGLLLLADVLISRSGQHANILKARPAAIGPENLVTPNYTAVGLSQKMVRLHDRSLLMWAGQLVVAESFCQHARDQLRDAPHAPLSELMAKSGLSAEELGRLSLILHRIGDDQEITCEFENCKDVEFEGQRAVFSGTGDFNFIDDIRPMFDQPAESDGEALARTWFHRVAVAFTNELYANESIQFGYGGWFELATPRSGRFEKLPYVIKYWRSEGDRWINMPAFHCWYHEDNLVVSRYLTIGDPPTASSNSLSIRDLLKRGSETTAESAQESFSEPELQLHVIIKGDRLYTWHQPGGWPLFRLYKKDAQISMTIEGEIFEEFQAFLNRQDLTRVERPFSALTDFSHGA